jgi:hypothetical protein
LAPERECLCTIAALIFVLETRTSQPKDRPLRFQATERTIATWEMVCVCSRQQRRDANGATTTVRPEAADVESSARPLVSGLWEGAWPAAEMGRCTWPTRVGTDCGL